MAAEFELRPREALLAEEPLVDRIAITSAKADLAPDRRVVKVVVEGWSAVTCIKISYGDGATCNVGKSCGIYNADGLAGKPTWTPLILGEDECLVEVKHWELRQWWWAGSGVEFATNKGRRLRCIGDWCSGLDEDAKTFKAESGQCIQALKIHNGICHSVIQGRSQCDLDEDTLKLWEVYWLAEGAVSDEVQFRGFAARDAALRFASRFNSVRDPVQLGPLRLEINDHPWCDFICEALRQVAKRLRHRFSNSQRHCNMSETAGIIVDIVTGTRVSSWGPEELRAVCEEMAAERGVFKLKEWRNRSMSLRALKDKIKALAPVVRRSAMMFQWRQQMPSLFLLALTMVACSSFDGLEPILTGAIFNLLSADEAEVRKESIYLHWICSYTFGCSTRRNLAKSVILGLLLIAVFRGVAKAFKNGAQRALLGKHQAQARIEIFEHLLWQDYARWEVFGAKQLRGKAQPQRVDAACNALMEFVSSAINLLTSLVVLFTISPLMTLAYAFALPFFEMFVNRVLVGHAAKVKASNNRAAGMNEVANLIVSEAGNMIKTVKTFSREEWHVELQRYAVTGAIWTRLTLAEAAAQIGGDTLNQALYCFSLWCGLVWMDSEFSAGEMTAFLLLISRIRHQVKHLQNQVGNVQKHQKGLTEYFEFLDFVPSIVSGHHSAQVTGSVEFKDVSFKYPARPEQTVLSNVSFELWPGRATALVGASGSGKSTAVALILRLYDPTQGQIFVDGVPLQNWDLTQLHRQMAVVSQEPLLFETTIKQNLLYGIHEATLCESAERFEDAIVEASMAANAHGFITSLPMQYDTHVGDRGGAQMSGGQRQRIAIARAMLMKPRILVLDEATSALDGESETMVQASIDRLIARGTGSIMMIAHRLSTVKNAHELVCLREGFLIERGTPLELLERKGYYYQLVSRQVISMDDIRGANAEMDRSTGAGEVDRKSDEK